MATSQLSLDRKSLSRHVLETLGEAREGYVASHNRIVMAVATMFFYNVLNNPGSGEREDALGSFTALQNSGKLPQTTDFETIISKYHQWASDLSWVRQLLEECINELKQFFNVLSLAEQRH